MWRLFLPTVWDWITTLGSLGLFALMYLVFVRLVPVVSMHEVRKLIDEERRIMTALLLAEFADSTRFVDAARRARRARYRLVDAFTPFPVEGMHELLEHRNSRIRVAMFIGGIGDGGDCLRPRILFGRHRLSLQQRRPAVRRLAGFHAGAVRHRHSDRRDHGLCRLPDRMRPAPTCIDPLFAVEGFERASQDRFVLAVVRPDGDDEVRHARSSSVVPAPRPSANSNLRTKRDHDTPPRHDCAPCRLWSVARGLRSEHDAAAQTHDLCADLAVARRHLGAASCRSTSSHKATSSAQRRPRTRRRSTAELLARGQERYGIFCAACHGLAGDGDGIIVAHGFPAPPSYHIDRLLAAPAQHFYDVITRGYGVMFSYADRVDAQDRWAIAAYIRALQLSRRVTLAEVPEAAEKIR